MASAAQRATELVARLRKFLVDDLWDLAPDAPAALARARSVVQFTVVVGQGFVRDQLLLRATSLAYFMVLSLIPILAIALSIGRSIGGASDRLAALIVEQVAAGSPAAQDRIVSLIEGVNFAGLGTLGAVTLFVTTVLGIGNVEKALNAIWGVRKGRTLLRRFPDYLAVIVIAPLLLTTALSIRGALQSQWIVQRILDEPALARIFDLGLGQAPAVFMSAAFAFLYWFLPNTRVAVLSAAIGGVVAGVLGLAAQNLYLEFQIGVARYNAVFGTLVALPLLFVWIYIFCAVFLFGAEIAFAHQHLELYRREARGERARPAEREAIGLRIALEVARAFQQGRTGGSAEMLADHLRASVRTVRSVLADLEAAAILAPRGSGDRDDGYQLARPAEQIPVVAVLAALRGEPQPLAGDATLVGAVDRVLAEIEEGAVKGSRGQTLADVIAALPAEGVGYPPAS
jgi:membrane protein